MNLPKKLLRDAATLACCVLSPGASPSRSRSCSLDDDRRELPVESGAFVEAARFSAGHAATRRPGLGPLRRFPFATKSEYALVESGPGVVLEGRADGSASGSTSASASIRAPSGDRVALRVLQTPGTRPRVHSRDDSPARVIVAFHAT